VWSLNPQYKDVDSIINHQEINAALESTKKASQDPVAIKAILEAAKERSFLTNYTPGAELSRSCCCWQRVVPVFGQWC
jgi:hypothetical protein